ncbi:MAG: class I SAM-dependent methyltransferase [Nitrosopumilaceae archaeon]
MLNLLVKNYTAYDFLNTYILDDDKRILNAGSSSIRYGNNCINVDIQSKPDVDIVCDIQDLPQSLGQFDGIICNGVLQYCQYPWRVAQEFYRVLRPGGYLFLDVPWVQPYCSNTPDRFRYSEHALRSIFRQFQIIEFGPSIRPGSAFAMLGVHIAGSLTNSKYVNFVLRKTATILLFPFRGIRTADEDNTCGALYMICRKPLGP